MQLSGFRIYAQLKQIWSVLRSPTHTCRTRRRCSPLLDHCTGVLIDSPTCVCNSLRPLQPCESGSAALANDHAEGAWKRRLPRADQRIPLEDAQGWTGRPWVRAFWPPFFGRVSRTKLATVTECCATQTLDSSRYRSSATRGRSCRRALSSAS